MDNEDDDILSLEDKRKLNLTASIRENIITETTKNGIPQDKDTQSFLIKALDGLDTNTLSQAKLKIDKKNKDENEKIAGLVTEFLMRSTSKPLNPEEKREQAPELPDSFIINDPVPGEKDIGVVDITLKELEENTGRS